MKRPFIFTVGFETAYGEKEYHAFRVLGWFRWTAEIKARRMIEAYKIVDGREGCFIRERFYRGDIQSLFDRPKRAKL